MEWIVEDNKRKIEIGGLVKVLIELRIKDPERFNDTFIVETLIRKYEELKFQDEE